MSLTEGRDYYKENGKYVFTEHYLLARNVCCHSGCRHCPYGYFLFNIGDRVGVVETGMEGTVIDRKTGGRYKVDVPDLGGFIFECETKLRPIGSPEDYSV